MTITLDVFVPQQALNNLQSTFSGFGFINSENVFKVQKLAWTSLSTKTVFTCGGQWSGGGTVLGGRGQTQCPSVLGLALSGWGACPAPVYPLDSPPRELRGTWGRQCCHRCLRLRAGGLLCTLHTHSQQFVAEGTGPGCLPEISQLLEARREHSAFSAASGSHLRLARGTSCASRGHQNSPKPRQKSLTLPHRQRQRLSFWEYF